MNKNDFKILLLINSSVTRSFRAFLHHYSTSFPMTKNYAANLYFTLFILKPLLRFKQNYVIKMNIEELLSM